MISIERIKKECFWDFEISSKDILAMATGNAANQKLLFSKILENSTELLQDLELFSLETLSILLNEYSIPKFNYNYLFRRKNIVEVHFFHKPLLIKELQWAR